MRRARDRIRNTPHYVRVLVIMAAADIAVVLLVVFG